MPPDRSRALRVASLVSVLAVLIVLAVAALAQRSPRRAAAYTVRDYLGWIRIEAQTAQSDMRHGDSSSPQASMDTIEQHITAVESILGYSAP